MLKERVGTLFLRLLALACLFTLPQSLKAQVSPFMGVGNVQFFGNDGSVLTNGCLYVFQAGTTTQVASFVDSTGTTQNTNPVCFGSGARASIWLTTGNFFKLVLCLQNDGAFCAAGDTLFTVDQVPGGSSGGGGGGGSPFIGIFISSSASPATSGILELASADTVCWRNQAGSTNICISKDTNDLLSWAGGSLKLPEVGAPTGVAAFDILWADNTAHRWKMANNGGAAVQIVAAGADINTSDQVTKLHFGATVTPLSSTAPTTNQFLKWNGTNIVGGAVVTEGVLPGLLNLTGASAGPSICVNGASSPPCYFYILPNTHQITRIVANVSTAPVGCGTNAQFGIRDITSASNLAAITPTITGITDSGALSVATVAGHTFAVGQIVADASCATHVNVASLTVNYQ
jgi:hypothetical protein